MFCKEDKLIFLAYSWHLLFVQFLSPVFCDVIVTKANVYHVNKDALVELSSLSHVRSLVLCAIHCASTFNCSASYWNTVSHDCKLNFVDVDDTSLMSGAELVPVALLPQGGVCSSSTPVLSILEADETWDPTFSADHVLTDGPCETTKTFLLAKDENAAGFKFVIDIGCQAKIAKAQLGNTHNSVSNDRGTDEFSIAVSLDKIEYTTVVTDHLPDARNKPCGPEIPLLEFDVNAEARFVKVTLISFYGLSSGLQFINFTYA